MMCSDISSRVRPKTVNPTSGRTAEALGENVHLRHGPAQHGENQGNDERHGHERGGQLQGDDKNPAASGATMSVRKSLRKMRAADGQKSVGPLESGEHPVVHVQASATT